MKWFGTSHASKIKNIDKSKIIVFDTETTGLSTTTDEILSISILDGYGSTLFKSLIKPARRKRWPKAKAINGISYSDVKNSPLFSSVKKEIQKIFDNAEVVVGYNVNFDIKFVEAAGIRVSSKTFDVMYEFAKYNQVVYGEFYKTCKLTECADFFGINYSAHDSYEDAYATLQCFNDLINSEDFTDHDNIDKNSHVHTKKIPITSLRIRSRRIGNVLKGAILIALGEFLYWRVANAIIINVSEYIVLLKSNFSNITIYNSELISLLLIGVGVIVLLLGLVKFIVQLPFNLYAKIKRLFNKIF